RITTSVSVDDLDEHVNDGLGSESGDRRAAEMLDAADEIAGETRSQMRRLVAEHLRPARIVGSDLNPLADELRDPRGIGNHFPFFFSKYAARSAEMNRASTRPGASPW